MSKPTFSKKVAKSIPSGFSCGFLSSDGNEVTFLASGGALRACLCTFFPVPERRLACAIGLAWAAGFACSWAQVGCKMYACARSSKKPLPGRGTSFSC